MILSNHSQRVNDHRRPALLQLTTQVGWRFRLAKASAPKANEALQLVKILCAAHFTNLYRFKVHSTGPALWSDIGGM
jgi:hypothetical protein